MAKIRIMDKMLANQIAAGEVVERPSSVVKELVENAIDASSRQIIIELEEAGIRLIRVTDDGEGMSQEDLHLSFHPHATSKIRDTQDLFHIHTLGFRGEALASITSVAKVRIESKVVQEAEGHYIEVHGSDLVDQGRSKARQGTMIEVKSLFYNTPARLKHLKTIPTELKHSLTFIQNIALAYPEIKFVLKNDGQVLFQSIGNGQMIQAVASIYQTKLARQLLPLHIENTEFTIDGFISPPGLTRSNLHYLHWMINHRTVKNRGLSEVLVKAYGRQLMIGQYPLAMINIQLDPHLVDVNVHPTKHIVRLSKEEDLSALLTRGVQASLMAFNPVPNIAEPPQVPSIPTAPSLWERRSQPAQDFKKREDESIRAGDQSDALRDGFHFPDKGIATEQPGRQALEATGEGLATIGETLSSFLSGTSSNQTQNVSTPSSSMFDISGPQALPLASEEAAATFLARSSTESGKSQQLAFPDFDHLHYLGQIHGTYLIAENLDGFYLIDQHAAQEKIRYETFMNTPIDQISVQQLLIPLVLDFAPDTFLALEAHLDKLKAWGIHLTPFGPQSYQIEAYPVWLEDSDMEKALIRTCEYVLKHPEATLNQVMEASLIMKSCRGAIKANHHLEPEEARHLIRSLGQLQDPYHCPHGRPTMIQITTKTLEKWFKRIQDPHGSRFPRL